MLSIEERNIMVEENLGLAKAAVNRFGKGYLSMHCPCVSEEDLLQTAYLALIQAAEKFDPSRDIAFSTYATYAIRRNLYISFQQMMTPSQCISFSDEMMEEYERISEKEKPKVFLGDEELRMIELKTAMMEMEKETRGKRKRNRELLLNGIQILLKRGEGFSVKDAGAQLGLTFEQAKKANQTAVNFFRKRSKLLCR